MSTNSQIDELKKRLLEIKETGTLDGENADRRENMHRLFMYPAMMVPATQSAIIEAITDVFHVQKAIDPFMGSGTSLLSCMEFGLDVFGQDINPFAVLLSKAKTTDYAEGALDAAFKEIKHHIEADTDNTIDISFNGINKWFNQQAQINFSKIRRAIMAQTDKDIRLFFWVLMSEAIRMGSNDRTSTFKLHRRSEEELSNRDIDIFEEFFQISNRGIADFSLFKNKLQELHNSSSCDFRGNSTIVWGNTQNKIESDETFDLLVSSPPYGDNHTTVTYGQTSYLPLQWIDPADVFCPYDYLRTTQEIDRQSLGGKIDRKRLAFKKDQLLKRSPSLSKFILDIPSDEERKYDKTILFIADFDECLDQIVKVMSDSAFFVWTIGNRFVGGREVPNDTILQDLMECRGLSLFFRAERKILNKKQPKKNNFSSTMEKEIILIFKKGK